MAARIQGKFGPMNGLTIDGKHVWQQQEEQKGDISTALMIRDTCLFPLFKDIQGAI